MSGSTKTCPAELRERAVWMVAEVRHEHSSEWVAVESVAGLGGVGVSGEDGGGEAADLSMPQGNLVMQVVGLCICIPRCRSRGQ